MIITYSATPSSSPLTATFYSLKGLTPEEGSSLSGLSADNYPADRVPLTDINGYNMPNPKNQIIFKNQPISWWIDSINSGLIKYTPVSNTVNWSYVDGETTYHILFETSSFMIPNRIGSVDTNQVTGVSSVVLQDNTVMNLTQTYPRIPPMSARNTAAP